MGTELGMESQFIEKELGECLELVIDHRGKTPKKLGADWVDSGIPTISAKNVNGGRLIATDEIRHVSHDVYKRWMKEDVKRGDCFLVSEGATLGECMMWDYDYPIVLGQRIFCLRANPSLLYPRYLYAYMTSASFQSEIIGRATGTSVDGLRQTEVLKLKLRLPPLTQQRQIGDTLYNLDKKIELNRRMNATLESMARALFQSWFVDFDPVRAKLDGREPAGMDAATASLFPEQFQESVVGNIPSAWSFGPITECCTRIHSGGTPRRDEPKYWRDGTIPWLTSGEVRQPMITSTESYISELGLNESAAKWIPANSTVVALYGATAGQVSFLGTSTTTNQAICSLVPKSGFEFFNYFVMRGATAEMESKAVGSAQQNISKGVIEETVAILPPPLILNQFNSIVAPLFANWIANTHQSRTLATLRDTLLPKLLSGELSVRSLERSVEAAL